MFSDLNCSGNQTRVYRDKPGIQIWNYGVGMTQEDQLDKSLSDSFKVSFIMFYVNMVDYPVFFPLMSSLTWDTFLTLRGTQRFYLKYASGCWHFDKGRHQN